MKTGALLAILAWSASLASLVSGSGTIRSLGQRPDILIADFEGDDYSAWIAAGDAFGTAPARGTLPNQMTVRGFRGRGLVHSYLLGDRTTGTLTSPAFRIERNRIDFLIGGGRNPEKLRIELLLDDRSVRTATGRDNEVLIWSGWDVRELQGRTARIRIVDEATGGWGHINVDHIIQSDSKPPDEDDRDGALRRADESVREAARRAETDPARPVFHFRPPGNWMNDPNGPLYHKGWYHMFYQHNPFGDQWGNMHWGHARSRDLIKWEHLPIALWPSLTKGEEHVFSGSAAINGQGAPMLFYTSIGHPVPEMWAASPDDSDLIKWRKHPRNPLLTATAQGTKFDDWRDPFVFRAGRETFLVHGGNLNQAKGGQAVVSLYRARNSELTEWEYRGILFQHPDPTVVNIECPNFFPLGKKWVLITSPHRACDYFVGDFDPVAGKFSVEKSGMVDFSDQFYAPNGLEDPKGRRILWGWVRGFPDGKGWNGCLSLPRVLTLGPDNYLRQQPAPEMKKLRGRPVSFRSLTVNGVRPIPFQSDTFEIELELDLGTAKRAGIRIGAEKTGESPPLIAFTGSSLEAPGQIIPLFAASGTLTLRAFYDKSVLELYANNGQACITRVLKKADAAPMIELFAESGTAHFPKVTAWPIKPPGITHHAPHKRPNRSNQEPHDTGR